MKWLDRLNKREKILILAVGALLLTWIAYSMLIEPLHNSLTRLNKDIEISKIELKKAVTILNKKESVIKDYNKYMARFLIKESEEEEMALILNEIEAQARLVSVRIVNMKPRRVEKSNSYRIFYVDLDTEATMQSVIKFIKKLKDSKFSICVEQLTLNSRTTDPGVLNGAIVVSRFGISPEE